MHVGHAPVVDHPRYLGEVGDFLIKLNKRCNLLISEGQVEQWVREELLKPLLFAHRTGFNNLQSFWDTRGNVRIRALGHNSFNVNLCVVTH